MKRFFIIACAFLFGIGCQNETASTEKSGTGTDSTEKIDYAYLPKNHPPDNWEPGDQKNVALALKALKAFETGNVEESAAAFADSVRWAFDGYDAKIPRDSLKAMFTSAWKNISKVTIDMMDYESVISKDKKEEWVTLWYKQSITDKAGKTDSVAYVNDLKIENGKIAVLDETSRKYPVK